MKRIAVDVGQVLVVGYFGGTSCAVGCAAALVFMFIGALAAGGAR